MGGGAGAAADPFAGGGGMGGLGSGGGGSPFGGALGGAKPPPGEASDPFAKLDLGGQAAQEAAPIGGAKWRVRTKAGLDAEVDLASLKDMVKRGEVGPSDEAGPLDGPMKAVSSHPILMPSARAPSGPKVSGARARSGGGPDLKRIAMLLVPIALIGAAAALFVLKPELFERQTDAGPNPLRRAKATWSKQFPDVSGTAADHLSAGRTQMKLDTAAGYRKADEELRQAILLDIGNVPAMALWVENFANLPAVRSDLEGKQLAEDAINFAIKKDPQSVDALRAQGALKLAYGDVDAAQKVLEQARASGAADSGVLLWLAKTHLERNPQDALNLLESEIKPKDPDLKHALVVEGAAHRRLGNFKQARDVLNARLTSDPQNTGALKEMAKLELDVGNPEEAIAALTRLLEAEERDVDAHLMRAKIAYQVLAKGGAATDGLNRA
jgi:tetratricopeptide (TPR) repeat protein